MDPRLHNCKSLRKTLGVGRDFITAMRFAGFPMPGGRATASAALLWLDAHPDFHPSAALAPTRPSQAKKARARSKGKTTR